MLPTTHECAVCSLDFEPAESHIETHTNFSEIFFCHLHSIFNHLVNTSNQISLFAHLPILKRLFYFLNLHKQYLLESFDITVHTPKKSVIMKTAIPLKYKFGLLYLILAIPLYGQKVEGISQSFKLKVENKQDLLEKLQRENRLRELIWQREMEKARNTLPASNKVSESTHIEVKPQVVMDVAADGSEEMNLQLSFSYATSVSQYAIKTKVSNSTDDYPPGAYNAMSSNACMLTCNFIKKKTETELIQYFIPGNQVTIKITGETDGTPIVSRIEYKGEYGELYRKMIYLNGNINDITVTKQSGITNNGQLAFLRTQGVEEFMKTYMDALQATTNTYQIYAVENQKKGKEYRKIAIEITIHGAFNKEMAEVTGQNKQLKTPAISEVNIDIPETGKNSTDCFALIIANEKYNDLIPSVPFAHNDGDTFKEYCIKTFGIPERQIKIIKDATLNGIQGGVDWLNGVMGSWSGKSKAIVYYAGHGVPNAETNSAYLVPTDANPTKVNQLYSLEKLYDTFAKVPCQSITYFLDACFSGTKRNGQMLIEDTRGIVIRPKEELMKGNSIVFSASSGIQTAHPFKEQKHGLFTFYLLKHIKESRGNITYGELFEATKKDVSKESSLDSKEQTPTVNTSAALISKWQQLKF